MINKKYEPKNFAIIFLCLFAGGMMLHLSGIFSVRSFDDLTFVFTHNLLTVIIGFLFILAAFYTGVMHIINFLKKPTEETVYLLCIKNNKSVFIDEMDRKYVFNSDSYEPKKFYTVLKNNASIKSVIGETSPSFIVDEEDPEVEDIVYEDNQFELDKLRNNTGMGIFTNIMKILVLIFITLPIIRIFLTAKTPHNKLVIAPFLIIVILMIFNTFANMLNNNILRKIISGLLVLGFTALFGTFSTMGIVSCIRTGNYSSIFGLTFSYFPIVVMIWFFFKNLKK